MTPTEPTEEKSRRILARLRAVVRHDSCWTCDCLHGLLTELQLDTEQDPKSVTEIMTFPSDPTHGCLGCDPCPPAELHVEYLREKQAHRRKRKP